MRLLVCATPRGGRHSRILPLVPAGAALELHALVLGGSDGRELTQQILAHYAGFHAHVAALEERAAEVALAREEAMAREVGELLAALQQCSAFPPAAQGARALAALQAAAWRCAAAPHSPARAPLAP